MPITMPITVWLASAMIGVALPIGWWALSTERVATNIRLQRPGEPRSLRESRLERSRVERMLVPLLRSIGRRAVRFTPVGWIDGHEQALAKAGMAGRFSAEQVLGAKIVLPAVIGALLGLRLVDQSQPGDVVVTIAFVVAAFFVPDLLVRAGADRRAESVTAALPDLLDQLTISVEAGLGFDAALTRISRDRTDPLGQELTRMLHDVRLGSSRIDALEALAARSQVDDLKTVVLTLRQAEGLGTPLATPLRNVADEMREKRRLRAEERAQRLPTLMIFPLGICILPALFVVILGPAVLTLGDIF